MLQTKYNGLASSARIADDQEMADNVKAARTLLDQQVEGRRGWLSWAGEGLMPGMWALARLDDEREEAERRHREEEEKQAQTAKIAEERERKEAEERALIAKVAEQQLEMERKARAAGEERQRDFARR